MKVMITGGAGFIGSNFILYLHQNYKEYRILNVDKLTYASDLKFLASIEGSDRYSFSKTDITDRAAVRKLIRDFQPDAVIHLAAESHVDNSISGPEPFVMTNVVGTFNLLEECRQFWSEGRRKLSDYRFHHVSTDEVYGSLGESGLFTEETAYAPNSPYSATKASSDFMVRSYHHTYGMNVVTTNCSNNFGPHQHDEKLIPTIVRAALSGAPIPVYGKGENVRDWLYVGDHCTALDLAFHAGRSGETYNVGGRNEWKNIDLVKAICNLMNDLKGGGPQGDYKNLISFVSDRPGHDLRYAIDATKIENELGWQNTKDFTKCLTSTIEWYLARYS